MMKTVQIQDIDVRSLCNSFKILFSGCCLFLCYVIQNMQDEMIDLMDVSSEIQETLGRSYNVPDGLDEDDLMGGELTRRI